jgi:hypothetical protein
LVQPLLAVMSRINNNGRSKAVEQKTKTKKAFGEQAIALTYREAPYMSSILFISNDYYSLLRWHEIYDVNGRPRN